MTAATIDYFDHEADIGIIGRGTTLEAAFEAAAAAVFAIMTPPASIKAKQSLTIEFEETDIELALVTWLNLLIAQARSEGLILGKFKLKNHNSHWQGKAWGEPWRKNLERGTEVKGATLTMLSVKKVDKLWEAKCVVDV